MDKESVIEAVLIAQDSIKANKEKSGVIEVTVDELIEYRDAVALEVINELRENNMLKEEL